MENLFNGECYSMGFIEALFLINKQLTESECFRYLDLCKKYKQEPSEDILKYSYKFTN